VVRHVWGQWRYEHDRPDHAGPEIAGPVSRAEASPVPASLHPKVLLFCGGGKDSLVAARVLDEAGVPYASYAYSHSSYGAPEPQHALIDGLLDHLAPVERHRHWVFDDLLDVPIERLAPELGVRSVTAAETPSSLFGALPLALAQGCTDVVVAHERSADVGNLVWGRTGEEINHQWGKSLDAERLLRDYVDQQLVAGLTYSSVLKPAHDVLIFRALADSLDAVPATHSCNVVKPWCLRCAKCAYVWLGYQAFLPAATNQATFGDRNLLDDPANQMWFEQMLGLGDHTPFECIGQVDEARLAFELLRRRGGTGAAMRMYEEQVGAVDAERLYRDLIAVAPDHHAMPPRLADRVVPVLERLAQSPMP
jgi:UDP-N-acetyl-alpha-D-muramoyl-L-alanyl-L-glutamate epimerase